MWPWLCLKTTWFYSRQCKLEALLFRLLPQTPMSLAINNSVSLLRPFSAWRQKRIRPTLCTAAAMAPKYKLTYFDGNGRAEPLKYMFAYKNVEYEDVRIKLAEWDAFKPKTPYGGLPLLEVDGCLLSESYAIMRYCAKQLGLVGKGDLEAAKVDEVLDYLKPLYDHQLRIDIFFSKDESKKKELEKKFENEIAAPYFKKFEHIVKQNGSDFVVGNELTWADFVVAHFLEECEQIGCRKPIIDGYPALAKHRVKILNLPGVKEWIKKRPKGEFDPADQATV